MDVSIIELPHFISDSVDLNFIVLRIGLGDVIDAGETESFSLITRTMVKGGVRKVVFDLKGVEFIDSIGLSVLINTAKMIRAGKGDVVLVNVPERIEEIMRPLNMNRFIISLRSEAEISNYFKLV
jgi:anti-anti-sigma factor